MAFGVAILGAGIFAREEHLPAVQATPLLSLKAVYSRSEKSASSLLQAAGGEDISAYYDSPESSGKSLDDLLARDDIDAVIIALPITLQPELIRKSINAGKHVLSEKPIAKDTETAENLLHWYKANNNSKIWSVAENFRFIESIRYAAEELSKIGGNVTTFNLQLFTYVDEANKYFNTEWRKVPQYQGGFLLDGGVHFVAGLRLLLGSIGEEIGQVSAFTTLLESRLAPIDTIHAIAKTKSNRNGTISLSFGTEFKAAFQIEVVTTNGAVKLEPTSVITTKAEQNNQAPTTQSFTSTTGVKEEIASFAQGLSDGEGNPLASPLEGLSDLKILQSILESGARGGTIVSIK